jgi:hypothetical protein
MDSSLVNGSLAELLRLLSQSDVHALENIEVGADPTIPDGPRRKVVRKLGKANVARMQQLLVSIDNHSSSTIIDTVKEAPIDSIATKTTKPKTTKPKTTKPKTTKPINCGVCLL